MSALRFRRLVLHVASLIAVFSSLAASPLTAAEAPSVVLARDGKALLPVVIAEEASDAVKATAGELAGYLGRISGATFTVETGDGSRGIVLGTPESFQKLPGDFQFGEGRFQREDYVLRSQTEALYLIGATDMAVSHAAWELLHRLGYRQFFPGETWEVIPSKPSLEIAVDERESPSFYARRIWYNWGLWGYNNEPYQKWCERNRAVQGFQLNSGHAYDSIIAANREEFEKHPEYLALIDGKRRPISGDDKFCVSNPGLRKLVVDWAVRGIEANPRQDSISMDPSDGGNWCECDECAKIGGVSTRVVILANDVAQAINRLGHGEKFVGMYAYNKHAAPPAIRVDPHVIPSATTAFIGGGFSYEQVVTGWQAQGATMGTYDYLSVVDWDWNLPRGGSASRPKGVADFLVYIHEHGIRFYDAESGDCWGPAGLGYYVASRVLWDVDEAKQYDAIIEDFLTSAFGSAKEPMREFYRLINHDTQRRPPHDLVGRMYRQLQAARQATTDDKVLKRLDDLTLYTRHAELYYAYANGSASVEDVLRHAYRMRTTMMVHSYGLWARLASQQAAATEGHPLKNDTPFSREELDQILAEGIAKNEPTDPGFESRDFSRKLVPAAEALGLESVPQGNFPASAQDHQQYYLWKPADVDAIDLEVRVKKVWRNREPKLVLHSPQEVSLNAVDTFEDYQADDQTRKIQLKSPYAGLHRLETFDGGDNTYVTFPQGMPVSIESGIDSPDVTSHFRGPWTMYFYVPKGTKSIGGWASRIANWAPRISGHLVDSEGRQVLDFGTRDEGWFNVPVPEGQDGRLWKFENTQGQRLLMTVPPLFARSAEELLLPEEVIQADAKKK